MTRPVLLCAIVLGLLACAEERGLDAAPTEPTGTPLSAESHCLQDGDFDFSLVGSELSPFEGRQARVVAYEGAQVYPQASPARRPADVRGVIRDGRFVATCPHALKENSAYPSISFFVDANGDGQCGPGDFGAQLQYYGWNAETAAGGFHLPLAVGQRTSPTWWPVESMHRADELATTFCTSYFD